MIAVLADLRLRKNLLAAILIVLTCRASAYSVGQTELIDARGAFSLLITAVHDGDRNSWSKDLFFHNLGLSANGSDLFERQADDALLVVARFRDTTGAIIGVEVFWRFDVPTILSEHVFAALIAKSSEVVTLDGGDSLRITLNTANTSKGAGRYSEYMVVGMNGRVHRSGAAGSFR